MVCTPAAGDVPKMPQDPYRSLGQLPPNPYGGFNSSAVTEIKNQLITIANHGGIMFDAWPVPPKLYLPLLFADADGSLAIADFGSGAGNEVVYYNRWIKPVVDLAVASGQITAADANNFKLKWLGAFGTLLISAVATDRTISAVNKYIADNSKYFNGVGTGVAISGDKWFSSPDPFTSFFLDAGHFGYAVPFAGSYYYIQLN
jgi:hypothetical protein